MFRGISLTAIFVLTLLCPLYGCAWGDSELYLDTSRMLRFAGDEQIREREFILDKWRSETDELYEQAKNLSGIRKQLAFAIISRLENPKAFGAFEANFLEAVITWADPARFVKSGKAPLSFDPNVQFALSATRYEMELRNQTSKLPWRFRNRYVRGLTIKFTQSSAVHFLEIALCGYNPPVIGEIFDERITEFGSVFRWKAWSVYLSQILKGGEPLEQGLKLLEELCLETDVLDSPVFLFYVTDLAVKHNILSLSVPIRPRLAELKSGIKFTVDGKSKTYRAKSSIKEIETFLVQSSEILKEQAKAEAARIRLERSPRQTVKPSQNPTTVNGKSDEKPTKDMEFPTIPVLTVVIILFCGIIIVLRARSIARRKRSEEEL